MMNLITDQNKKDIFNRNCLFYLFIDFSGDSKKIEDPYKILEFCLNNNLFQISINEKDIFGNSLLNYSVKGSFMESMKVLLKYGALVDYSVNYEGNISLSIFSKFSFILFFFLFFFSILEKVFNIKTGA